MSARDDALDLPYSPFPSPLYPLPSRPRNPGPSFDSIVDGNIPSSFLRVIRNVPGNFARARPKGSPPPPCAPINSGLGCGIEYFDTWRDYDETCLRRFSYHREKEFLFWGEDRETLRSVKISLCEIHNRRDVSSDPTSGWIFIFALTKVEIARALMWREISMLALLYTANNEIFKMSLSVRVIPNANFSILSNEARLIFFDEN